MGAGISLAAALGAPTAAQAEDFTVTTLGDPAADACVAGDCSLREAVEAAEANVTDDRVLFQAGLSGTIALTGGELYVSEPLEVLGLGAEALTVSGGQSSRIFHIDSADPVTISGLTLSGANAGGGGGAVRSRYANLTIRDSTISGNDADFGGGVYSNQSELAIERSTISGNDAVTSRGGGIYAYQSTLTIERSTISANDAITAGGGIVSTMGLLTIESSTISGNEAILSGGGIDSYSFVSPNLTNTIVAGNAAPNSPDLLSYGGSAPFSVHFSLIAVTQGAAITEPLMGSNIFGQSPQLGALADNGGPTETMALPPTSPAVNTGMATGPDQRGLPRPVAYPGVPFSNAIGANGADIGAFELQLPSPISNNISFGKLTLNRRRGIAILRVRVPAGGRVILLRTPKVRRAVRTPAAARVVRLPVRARGKALRRLNRTGRVRVRARVRFRPTGGTPRTKSRMVRLVKRRRR